MKKGSRRALRNAEYEACARAAIGNVAQYGTVLYVGAMTIEFALCDLLSAARVYVLEVFEPYVEALRKDGKRRLAGVIQGDVREAGSAPDVLAHAPYDLLVWWHGPEHVSEADALELLKPGGKLDPLWAGALLIGCPWGRHAHGATHGNPHQQHLWTVYPEWLEALGFDTAVIGRRDGEGGHVTAWKRRAGGTGRPGAGGGTGPRKPG